MRAAIEALYRTTRPARNLPKTDRPDLKPRIYLDHAATTPILPTARAAVAEAMVDWANPSSAHAEGRRARVRLDDCRGRIAAALGWRGTIVLTSGATEALAIALGRTRCDRRILSAVEHAAAHRAAPDSTVVAVDRDGCIDIDAMGEAVGGAASPLACVQHANSETGVLHPVDRIADLVRAAGGLLLVDASQTAGKLPLPKADMIVVSSHKLGGPPGAGALLLRDPAAIVAVGGQENGLRPGTQDVPAIAGFTAALEADASWFATMPALRTRLEDALLGGGAEVVGSARPRIPTIGAYRMPGVPAAAQLIHMDMAGIAVSAGSACSSGAVRPSESLTAMGWPEAEAGEVVRVSFGRGTSVDDVDAFVTAWTALAARRRAA